MEIVLTHEQADFDALASLFSAHCLIDGTHPVLPTRVNRNVRNFLNLYGGDFPFIEARDLPQELIGSITLVDTQSLVTLKGITAKTRVHVIDHHDKREDFPADWDFRIEKVGSTTTILVDLLKERNIEFTMIEATLLLLGIYEDTGSLSYASTNVRDIRAAAYLLEKGASLHIASGYLNPALSETQKQLTDRLIKNAKTVCIHGKSILISSADAAEVVEEVSSIAHKLRDLLDPDALFLLVRTPEGIRLVARSTTDEVNVARVARHFGGGGHERASAALIQWDRQSSPERIFEQLTAEIINHLKKVIQPPITLSKIMSKRPHLLSPSTSLEEANRLMQRYGYEGYPVVKDEKVVGLLTRRAVDRAISHKLKLNVGSLMEAGDYTLKSTDTIEQLQKLMSATGWGQIPILDSQSGRITGIVTRTDLLKILPGHESAVSSQRDYSAKIEKALPPTRLSLLKLIARFSSDEHLAIYIVGGFVRDLLLEKPSLDFDFVIEGDALQFAGSLTQKFGGRFIGHRRFGTAKWQIKNIHKDLSNILGIKEQGQVDLPDSLDFISARTEFYDRPTALPTVERSSIKLDLHRRDFTINTLALRLDGNHYGELLDYWGGLADLEKKLVRVLHSLSFVDDPTRLLRAVRFEQRFNFTIEKRTLELMLEARELLHQLSGERIHHEFDLIFEENDPSAILTRLSQLNLLQFIHPDLSWEDSLIDPLNQALEFQKKSSWNLPTQIRNSSSRISLAYLVWLGGIQVEPDCNICSRLRLSNSISDTLEKMKVVRSRINLYKDLPPSVIIKELEVVPLLGIVALYCLCSDDVTKTILEEYATRWRFVQPTFDGNTLRQRGIPPGPRYAEILARIRSAWLDGLIKSKADEDKMLEEIISGD